MNRMDRYEDNSNELESKFTRINKNKELYTDVYLNNVYVDLNNLENVMKKVDDNIQNNTKIVHENEVHVSYQYEEKIYDIKELVENAIKNKTDDNVKRSLESRVNDLELDNLIDSLVKNQDKNDNLDVNVLTDLLPTNDNTELIPPLLEPILENSISKEENTNNLNKDTLKMAFNKNDLENDIIGSSNKNKKIVISIVVFIILVIISVIILFFLKVF